MGSGLGLGLGLGLGFGFGLGLGLGLWIWLGSGGLERGERVVRGVRVGAREVLPADERARPVALPARRRLDKLLVRHRLVPTRVRAARVRVRVRVRDGARARGRVRVRARVRVRIRVRVRASSFTLRRAVVGNARVRGDAGAGDAHESGGGSDVGGERGQLRLRKRWRRRRERAQLPHGHRRLADSGGRQGRDHRRRADGGWPEHRPAASPACRAAHAS